MDYNQLKKDTAKGWNTWNSSNVLSHVLLPYGFAINLCIKDFSSTEILREAKIGAEAVRPGIRSYDGQYTELSLSYMETELYIQSTVVNGEQYILVTPIKQGKRPPALIIEACLLWGREGSIEKSGGTLKGRFQDKTVVVFVNAVDTKLPYTYAVSPNISVTLDKPILISTVPCDLETVQSYLSAAKETLKQQADQYGENSEAYTAMKSCLAWDTFYECEHDRICSTVSRIWNTKFGGYALFCWDTYFAAVMASLENRELAYLNLFAITEEMTESGFVPNFGAAHHFKSRDRSQPPVGACSCLAVYKRWQESWILEQLYPALLRWNTWFFENRTTPEGYMCWGSNPFQPVAGLTTETQDANCRFGAALESGLDNSPMYDKMGFDKTTHLSLLADVGLMGLYIADCEALIEIADILGLPADMLMERKEKIEAALETLWCEKTGLYLNKHLDTGKLSHRISPTNFYALYSTQVSETRIQRMIEEHFYNPEEFWGEYILPSIARNDPAYYDQDYWRGRIWAPMNYLVYQAFQKCGQIEVCRAVAEKSRALLLKEWLAYGHVHENYHGDTGEGCDIHNSDPFYHWGGLLGYIPIDFSGK